MKRARLLGMLIFCAAVVGALLLPTGTVTAQQGSWVTPYNPYPTGILPADLVSEIARVRREVNVIFQQALAQWHALPPPTVTGQPPTLQG